LLKSAHLEKSEQAPLMRKFIQKYQLLPLEDYHYVNQSDVISIDDVDDEAEFEMTLQCMKNVHFTDPEIAQILDVVVAILNIGNIDFGLLKDDNVGPAA
jgi:myosin heavy subunit